MPNDHAARHRPLPSLGPIVGSPFAVTVAASEVEAKTLLIGTPPAATCGRLPHPKVLVRDRQGNLADGG